MESMITLVTASMASGINAAVTRKSRLEVTTFGADFQTIRKSGGILRRARRRSLHREGGPCCFSVGFALIDAGLTSSPAYTNAPVLRQRRKSQFLLELPSGA